MNSISFLIQTHDSQVTTKEDLCLDLGISLIPFEPPQQATSQPTPLRVLPPNLLRSQERTQLQPASIDVSMGEHHDEVHNYKLRPSLLLSHAQGERYVH